MPANLENSAAATALEKVSFYSNSKERQWQRMFKVPHSVCQQIRKSQQWPPLEKLSFHFNPKERQCQRMFKLPHNYTHLICSKFSKPAFNSTWTKNFQMFSQFSHSVMSNSLQPHGLQHTRPPCPSRTPGVYPNSCPSSQWCHPTISSSLIPFPSCLQSFPASESFPMSQLFASGGQSIGISASTWTPFRWTPRTDLL